MDADDEYALDDYEAESPPRASQQPRATGDDEASPASDSDADDAGDGHNDDAPHGRIDAEDYPTRERREAAAELGRQRKRPLDKKPPPTGPAARVASLTRKLAHATKRNAEMHNQLQRFYQNDAIAFLENKAQERLRQIEMLQVENRTLLHQQRTLNKQIEELHDAMESMPTKRIAQREELRVCREQLRHFKDTQKVTEEKCTRLHQQVVDLTAANKALSERVRQLESELTSTSSSPSPPTSSQRSNGSLGQEEAEAVIASQEDEITRLQHRVDVLKKAAKLDQAKHDKQATAALEELERARSDLETFHHRVFEKEKVVRSQFLELKQLKRSLKDALAHIHTNQELFESMGGRQVRFASQSGAKTVVANGASAHETLSKLGLLRLTSSASNAASVRVGAGATSIVTSPRIQDTGAHSVRHVPCPPSGLLGDKKTPRSARSHAQPAAPTTPASRISARKRSQDHSTEIPFYEDVDNTTFAPIEPAEAQPAESVLP